MTERVLRMNSSSLSSKNRVLYSINSFTAAFKFWEKTPLNAVSWFMVLTFALIVVMLISILILFNLFAYLRSCYHPLSKSWFVFSDTHNSSQNCIHMFMDLIMCYGREGTGSSVCYKLSFLYLIVKRCTLPGELFEITDVHREPSCITQKLHNKYQWNIFSKAFA